MKDTKNLEWTELRTEHLIQDKWIDFRKSAYRFPDGTEFEPYYSYSRRDYAVIVATDPEGRYVCVRQFRHGIRQVTTEFPAGGIERSDGKEYGGDPDAAEDALSAAKRELLEETGYASEDWSHLITLPSNATISDNYAYIYRARNCERVSAQRLDKTEFLHVTLLTPAELEALVRAGGFQQMVHVMAWLLSRQSEA
ncbi:MAG: NUDIX hydrolase [Oscillospiraceae bacterium]|nr:NUDIX hydrolase [Oscillospiraceae bacterium]